MTRNQRLRRRLRAEQRQARRCKIKKDGAIRAARQEELIRLILNQRQVATPKLSGFEEVVFAKAPRLRTCDFARDAVRAMKPIAPFRQPHCWQPEGKSPGALLNSLASHLFAQWTMPKILWSAFWDDASLPFKKAVTKIAGGRSLFQLCKSGEFPLALSKKQCHRLMKMPAKMTLMEAIRLIQLQDIGGDKLLFEQWWQAPEARRCNNKTSEAYWQQVLSWLVQNRNLDSELTSPELQKGVRLQEILAYFRYKHIESKTFSVKGRSVDNVLSRIKVWHKEQELLREQQSLHFAASGWMGLSWKQDVKRKNGRTEEVVWQLREILSKADLLIEGRTMRNCVFSYRTEIQKGKCSIWTLSENGHKCITLELQNHTGRVVQIRGKANRRPFVAEMEAVNHWAKHNDLRIVNAF